MINLLLFDLDGVLIKAKEIHFAALNDAIKEYSPEHVISVEDHLKTFDGLKTYKKLELLSLKGLDPSLHELIWKQKQYKTVNLLKNITEDSNLISIFESLSKLFKIGCCSNSISKSIYIMLSRLGIINYFDFIVSNEDVQHSKPHPEIYWIGMIKGNEIPENTLIIEDSPTGLLAAHRATNNVLRIKNPSELSLDLIINYTNKLNMINIPKWKDEKLNILIPMAGEGSRFKNAGYTFPKPLITVKGKPMIQFVIDNLNIDANFIFIVQKNHYDKYNLETMLRLITNNKCEIIITDGITEGAAITTLKAKNYINNNNPLIIANSDQYIEWNSNDFMYKMNEKNVDGGIVTFTSIHPKWSFAKINEEGYVVEVAEKNPISDIATAGIYYYKNGSDYVKYAEQMIEKNIRTNNEFYVCPIFNEYILDNKKIITYPIEIMHGIGTPEDLDAFLKIT